MNASTPMTQNSPNTNGVEVNEILGIIDDIDSDLLSVSCARRRANAGKRAQPKPVGHGPFFADNLGRLGDRTKLAV